MPKIVDHIQQDTLIDNDTDWMGMISGFVTVDKNSTLLVYGMVNGNVTINSGCSLIIYGIVNGDIVNAGTCKVFGVVDGKLIRQGGHFEIDDKAIIRKS